MICEDHRGGGVCAESQLHAGGPGRVGFHSGKTPESPYRAEKAFYNQRVTWGIVLAMLIWLDMSHGGDGN